MRILAIDYGTRRVGLALSDASGILATPYAVLENHGRRRLIERILGIVADEGVARIVVGLPVQRSGSLSESGRAALRFARRLAHASPVPVTGADESYTTTEAQSRIDEAASMGHRTAMGIDAVAAAVLLEQYLQEIPDIPDPLPYPSDFVSKF